MDDIESVLEGIRINSIYLSKVHKKRYIELQKSIKYFRIPVIILSAINSIVSVSQQYLEQRVITGLNSLLSLTTGIIGSIEMFLGINSQMESEQASSKEYYKLSTEIYKNTMLKGNNRPDLKPFLEECYSTYIKLLDNSCMIYKTIADELTPLHKNIITKGSQASSPPSSLSSIYEYPLLNRDNIENSVI